MKYVFAGNLTENNITKIQIYEDMSGYLDMVQAFI